MEVAIKKFRNMTSASSEFLNEVKNNLELGIGYCNRIYGVTRDTKNGEYAIVIEFQNGGNLRELIKKNHSILNWKSIINILENISYGLNIIHNNNYHHKDFHSGNILNNLINGNISSVISDFGLSCPVEQNSEDKTLYGVLPFVAPEVLRGEEFTKAADIYGFGMLMSEIINGEVPFIGRDYDLHLAFDICEEKRPLIPEYTPEPHADLMKRCWDSDPNNRPTAKELWKKFYDWKNILSGDNSSESDEKLLIQKAFSFEREDKWKIRLAELAKNPRPLKKSQNLFTSKRLDFSKQLLEIRNVKMNDKLEKLETKDVEIKKNDDGM
ncbi:kinase-like domain-containing protein [Glomus cerebriforme]|uniref:Kinase-like domain-containing protein n=1 Tax=Glomus cerebriforme TaxID=658196 RepID=A0A397S6G6_9GLOM|nr:kinase-like domain-containing protein [Glomus cerebriforme]